MNLYRMIRKTRVHPQVTSLFLETDFIKHCSWVTIFSWQASFYMFCNILLGQGLEMLFSYFSSGPVVIAAACFNSPGIVALCVGICFIYDPLNEFAHQATSNLE